MVTYDAFLTALSEALADTQIASTERRSDGITGGFTDNSPAFEWRYYFPCVTDFTNITTAADIKSDLVAALGFNSTKLASTIPTGPASSDLMNLIAVLFQYASESFLPAYKTSGTHFESQGLSFSMYSSNAYLSAADLQNVLTATVNAISSVSVAPIVQGYATLTSSSSSSSCSSSSSSSCSSSCSCSSCSSSSSSCSCSSCSSSWFIAFYQLI